MNGGSLRPVTIRPFRRPNATQTVSPSAIASNGLSPLFTASRVMMMVPNAITAPAERSIPAVRITSVWPIPMMPTTAICWTTSEKLSLVRKRSVLEVKKTDARMSASSGPRVDIALARVKTDEAPSSEPVRLSRAISELSTLSIVARQG